MTPRALDPTVLDATVEGRNLQPGPLRDQIGPSPTLLVFLRHLGCLFAREWLAELQDREGWRPDLPGGPLLPPRHDRAGRRLLLGPRPGGPRRGRSRPAVRQGPGRAEGAGLSAPRSPALGLRGQGDPRRSYRKGGRSATRW